jgi:hypothetical protein
MYKAMSFPSCSDRVAQLSPVTVQKQTLLLKKDFSFVIYGRSTSFVLTAIVNRWDNIFGAQCRICLPVLFSEAFDVIDKTMCINDIKVQYYLPETYRLTKLNKSDKN